MRRARSRRCRQPSSDARSQLNITAQLLGVNSPGQSSDSMTLNGPTSKVWLDHWKTYLKGQGVGFFVGSIASLAKANGRFMPCWHSDNSYRSVVGPIPEDPELRFKAPSKNGEDIEQFRFVLALSYQKVTDLLWEHADDVMSASGPFRQIVEFDVNGGRRKFGNPGLIPIDRDPLTGAEPLSYPLRTISGVQMFFPGNYRFGEGNVYFARTPWDLTSISQLSYWKNPRLARRVQGTDFGGYRRLARIRRPTGDQGLNCRPRQRCLAFLGQRNCRRSLGSGQKRLRDGVRRRGPGTALFPLGSQPCL